MKRILLRSPALDGVSGRLVLWWQNAAPRERWLVGVMGVLLALVVLVYGVVKPLQAARADALADIRTYETLTARIRAAGTLTTPRTGPRREGSPAKVASDAASGFGLAVTPQDVAGGVRVTIADAPYESVMAWLGDLSASSNLRVRRLDLRRGTVAGRVAGTVEFTG